MKKLSTLIVPALAAIAVTATPAIASSAIHRPTNPQVSQHLNHPAHAKYSSHGQAANLQRDITRLESRIDRAFANRQISKREANSLRRDVRDIQRLLRQSQRGGLSRSEVRTIENRIAHVNRALQAERRDDNWRRN